VTLPRYIHNRPCVSLWYAGDLSIRAKKKALGSGVIEEAYAMAKRLKLGIKWARETRDLA